MAATGERMRWVRVVLAASILMLHATSVRAQVACGMALSEMVAAQVTAAPLADQTRGNYQLPTQTELALVDESVGHLFEGNVLFATEALAKLGLTLCWVRIFPNVDDWVWVAVSEDGFWAQTSRGMAILAWRDVGTSAAAVISVPHAVTETNVALQAVEAMASNARVRAIVVGPVHRCHLLALAPEEFQGSTTECGGSYRQSDMAHTQSSLFHAFHAALWSRAPQDVLVQIHGMSAAGISVSAGTALPLMEFPNRPALLMHDQLSSALEALLEDAATLTTCSLYDGPRGDRVRAHLCGTRNAQRAGLQAAGILPRFVHLEQALAVRTDPDKRSALAGAIARTVEQVFTDSFER